MHPQEHAIYQCLAQTLLGGHLPPGARMIETRLARVFGVSRERVRKVLHRLGHARLLDVIVNRGCFVPNPTLVQAREIYEARRIVEGGIAGRLAGRLSGQQIDALVEHGQREHQALAAGDRALSIRLSGEFHLLLAGFAGSPFVLREMQELVSRTSMLVAFFEPAASSSCACEEHQDILDALRRGDGGRAMKAMQVHLSLIETRLTPRVPAIDTSGASGDTDASDATDGVIADAWAAMQAAADPAPVGA
ncbi:FCD domain-containing protein [Xylophilus sp. Kf1]|nr:FCD domain-containing protein [Xylophilus sp. Kf1]